MQEDCCSMCQKFIQHYVEMENGYVTAGWGHCTYPRIKARKINAKPCEHYCADEDRKQKKRLLAEQ